MSKLSKMPKHTGALIALVNAMSRDVYISEETQLFIVSTLSSEDNVQNFNSWVSTKISDGKFFATEDEIIKVVNEIINK